MLSRDLRERIGLSRAEWARALNVNERTVVRWEDEGVDPGGPATAIMKGIDNAIAEGGDPLRIGRRVSLGIGSLLYQELIRQARNGR